MKSLRDEIRLRREIGTDLILSAKQISSERSEDFIAPCPNRLKNQKNYGMLLYPRNLHALLRILNTERGT